MGRLGKHQCPVPPEDPQIFPRQSYGSSSAAPATAQFLLHHEPDHAAHRRHRRSRQTAITTAIDAMKPTGNTMSRRHRLGLARTVEQRAFTEGRDNNEMGNDKVVIVLTDGATMATRAATTTPATATYAAYGYAGQKFAETSRRAGSTRAPAPTSPRPPSTPPTIRRRSTSTCAHARTPKLVPSW